ncbi:exonuclease v chloroplastic [Phtheirospermum japonicum]|uniref:Exonuclease v chloroplastic n=1 Tax=Phtheirospermum japonicum TaxID=374723 RepID=A0A830CSA3_9LAMI|nr:exonuclease v chloroplastic [Phtheirospermum japonicum]
MKAGSARHVVLEEEVIKRVKVHVQSAEDVWALKFMNFIVGANQLLFDGLTRELPLVGFVEGVWMVGIIDEIRMSVSDESKRFPILVDTKTRVRANLPGEPQRRNGRYELQEDNSLLGEDEFGYEAEWVKDQMKSCLEFWLGKREATYAPMDERWKCRHCKFVSVCPANGSPSETQNDDVTSSDDK